jgi:hypothetical protein
MSSVYEVPVEQGPNKRKRKLSAIARKGRNRRNRGREKRRKLASEQSGQMPCVAKVVPGDVPGSLAFATFGDALRPFEESKELESIPSVKNVRTKSDFEVAAHGSAAAARTGSMARFVQRVAQSRSKSDTREDGGVSVPNTAPEIPSASRPPPEEMQMRPQLPEDVAVRKRPRAVDKAAKKADVASANYQHLPSGAKRFLFEEQRNVSTLIPRQRVLLPANVAPLGTVPVVAPCAAPPPASAAIPPHPVHLVGDGAFCGSLRTPADDPLARLEAATSNLQRECLCVELRLLVLDPRGVPKVSDWVSAIVRLSLAYPRRLQFHKTVESSVLLLVEQAGGQHCGSDGVNWALELDLSAVASLAFAADEKLDPKESQQTSVVNLTDTQALFADVETPFPKAPSSDRFLAETYRKDTRKLGKTTEDGRLLQYLCHISSSLHMCMTKKR